MSTARVSETGLRSRETEGSWPTGQETCGRVDAPRCAKIDGGVSGGRYGVGEGQDAHNRSMSRRRRFEKMAREHGFGKKRSSPHFKGWVTEELCNVSVNSATSSTFVASQYNDRQFQGACEDTGSRSTVICVKQAKAYRKMTGKGYILQRSRTRYKFDDGCRHRFGALEIRLPIPNGG